MSKLNFDLNHIKDEALGDWAIETFEIPEFYAKIRNLVEKNHLMHLKPGTFKRLTYRGHVIMSNTAMERRTHVEPIKRAKGNVLVAGLGLGMYLQNIKDKEDVTSITVVEYSKEVIELIGKYYKDCEKIRIINEDIFEYVPDINFDFAFFDIWSDTNEHNLKDFELLREKFNNIPDMNFWSEDIIKINLELKK